MVLMRLYFRLKRISIFRIFILLQIHNISTFIRACKQLISAMNSVNKISKSKNEIKLNFKKYESECRDS